MKRSHRKIYRKKETHPLVGKKNRSFPFLVSTVCWIDLLGYGAMIAEAGFNPLHAKSVAAIGRLRRFHAIVAKHSTRYFPTLVMNDGAVAYRDLSLRTKSVTHDFITRAWALFSEINSEEKASGFPGSRLVLAAGFRLRGRRAGMDATSGHFASLIRRYQIGEISADQAIREAARMRQTFDIVPQLQANFAFTRAYVADSVGAAGGLGGSSFFIDSSLFDVDTLPWIRFGDPIHWSHERLGLHASFLPVIDFPTKSHPGGGPIGLRDGLRVAQQLTNDSDVLRALRSAAARSAS